jgi:hypothetical protein
MKWNEMKKHNKQERRQNFTTLHNALQRLAVCGSTFTVLLVACPVVVPCCVVFLPLHRVLQAPMVEMLQFG